MALQSLPVSGTWRRLALPAFLPPGERLHLHPAGEAGTCSSAIDRSAAITFCGRQQQLSGLGEVVSSQARLAHHRPMAVTVNQEVLPEAAFAYRNADLTRCLRARLGWYLRWIPWVNSHEHIRYP